MCFCLTEGGTLVFDLSTEPWNTIRKRDIKPMRVEYADKEIRRTRIDCSHKTANWSLTKCIKLLKQHPMTNVRDILILKTQGAKGQGNHFDCPARTARWRRTSRWAVERPYSCAWSCALLRIISRPLFFGVHMQELGKNWMHGILTWGLQPFWANCWQMEWWSLQPSCPSIRLPPRLFCPLNVGIVKYLCWREHPHRKWRMLLRQCVQTFYTSSKTGG